MRKPRLRKFKCPLNHTACKCKLRLSDVKGTPLSTASCSFQQAIGETWGSWETWPQQVSVTHMFVPITFYHIMHGVLPTPITKLPSVKA